VSKKKEKEPTSPFAGKLKALKDKMIADEARTKPEPKGSVARPPAPRMKATPPAPATGDDDDLAFHRLMAGVTPLGEGAKRVPRSQAVDAGTASHAAERRQETRAAADADAEAVRDHLRQLVEGGARFEIRDDGRFVEGRRPEVPQDTFRALRRGDLPIDARFDLHGFAAAEAREELEGFLRLTRARGDRCVLVIHGKGEHAPRGHGVLRGEIAAWLAQGRASDSVAAFATAQGRDGGEGAVYVLLRRC